MRRTTLYILCGLSFAGKSTLAKRLSGPLDATVVECDSYIEVVRPNRMSKLGEWRAIQNLARARVKDLLESGESVVYDDLMVMPENRAELALLADRFGAKCVTLYLNTPAQIVRQRQRQRSPTDEQQAVWDDHTRLLLTQLVPPPKEESVYVEPGYDLKELLDELTRRFS